MLTLPRSPRSSVSPTALGGRTPASLSALMGLCLLLVGWGLSILPALAQFNGTNGIYALNHMQFGVMSGLSIINGGSGYVVGDVLTLDCPSIFVTGTKPTATVTAASGGVITSISLATPGLATQIPSTGLAGQPNGVCNFIASGGSGSGAIIYGSFGFNAASLNGLASGGGGGGGGSSAGTISATSVGMAAGTQDNSPFLPALMAAISATPSVFAGGYDVVFPGIPGQLWTTYYFTKPLSLSRGAHYYCGGGPTQYNSVILLFAAGIDGVIQESGSFSADGGAGLGTVDGCAIVSQGFGSATVSPSSNSITAVNNFNGDQSGTVPASSFGIGDGIIVVPTLGGFYPDSCSPATTPGTYISAVAGSTLTLGGSYTICAQFGSASALFTLTPNTTNNYQDGDTLTIGNNTYTARAAIGVTAGNFLIGSNFLNSNINLANCIDNDITTSTCVAPTNVPNITADLPVAQDIKFWAATGGTAGNSLTSTYTPVGTSTGSFAHATFTLGANSGAARFFQLPTSQAFTVQTTISSNSVLATAGPRLLEPGDLVWSDAFPFGTTIQSVSGTLGNQTALMNTSFMTGVAQNATVTHTAGSPGTLWILPAGLRRNVTASSNNLALHYWPLGEEMACASGSGTNCTISHDTGVISFDNLIGRWVASNNTGGSTSINEQETTNFIADVFEGASVGETYYGLNSESGESGTSRNNVLQNCINQNYSVSIGGYLGGAGHGGCAAPVGVVPATSGGMLQVGPNEGTPIGVNYIAPGHLVGLWTVQSGVDATNCISFGIPLGGNWYSFGFSNGQCSTNTTWGWGYNNTLNSWDLNFAVTGLVERDVSTQLGYTGYVGRFQGKNFPVGILLDNFEFQSTAPANSRLLSMGPGTVPTGTWHLGGDIQLNAVAAGGGTEALVDTSSFSTTLGGSVTAGTTTSVTVGACPATALPAGIVIDDITTTNPNLRLLGTLSSCTATTLTFQAVASNSGVNGDTINFMQWRPAAPIAVDPGGIIYSLGVPTAIASLPTCGGATIGYAVVNNGTAYATGVYGSTVSATGALTRPVFCNGSNWVYD